MKSRYISWKHGLISLAGLIGLAGLAGCKKLTCEFTYSPAAPVAGEVVYFSNHSTGADDYLWNFGDNSTSTITGPTHVYKKPGTYTVTLSIIRNKVEKRTYTQHVTVGDTVPALAVNPDPVHTFEPVKFYVNLYNPWNKTLKHQWTLPDEAVVIAGSHLDSSAVVCYFNQSDITRTVQVDMQTGDNAPVRLTCSVTPVHTEAPSLLYVNAQDTMEQFTYFVNQRRVFQQASRNTNTDNSALLAQEQDTLYHYGSKSYTVTSVQQLTGKNIQGFQVDRLMGKIYAYGPDGLWVCNMAGAHVTALDTRPVLAVKVDGAGNCLYWSTAEGLFVHSLLQTQDNREPFSADMVTDLYPAITRISVNSNPH